MLIPLQGLAAVVTAAQGPLHTHRPARVHLVLDDLRRSVPIGLSSSRTLDVSSPGHVHGIGARHHHARGDASVERSGRAGMASTNPEPDDDVGALAASAAFLALLPGTTGPVDSAAGHVAASRNGWPPLTHDPRPFERPPRAA